MTRSPQDLSPHGPSLKAVLRARLARRRAQGLYRVLRERGPGPVSGRSLEGREVVDFCSNDYLGLSTHPRVIDAFTGAAQRWGVGAGAARLVSGHTTAHAALEEQLARWTGRDRALVFSTGYMANLGAITALAGREDVVFQARLNHASLLDAARLSGARLRRYRDPAHLARLLEASPARHRLVVTDGVFSMDGTLAPLPELAALCRRFDAWLLVDDAPGVGVVGPGGGGTVALYGLGQAEVPVLVGTFGKALGGFGAFVAGPEVLIETLVQEARSHVYTTAPPPAVSAAVLAALEVLETEPEHRERLRDNVRHFRNAAQAQGLPLSPSQTPIQPLLLGSARRATAVSATLLERGFWVAAIRPPTVPPGTARLRITLSAVHRADQIDALVEALGTVLRETG